MSGLFIPGIMVNLGILLTPGKPDSKARCAHASRWSPRAPVCTQLSL